MMQSLFTCRAWAVRALLATLALTLGGAAFAFNLQILAAEVSMTSSTTITECPEFDWAEIVEAVCLLGESMFGSAGVDLARSSVQLAAMQAGLRPFRGWQVDGDMLRAGWIDANGVQGLFALIYESEGMFVLSLLQVEP